MPMLARGKVGLEIMSRFLAADMAFHMTIIESVGNRRMAESTEELFERAIRLHSRRLLAIARAIVGNRASAEDIVQQAVMNLYTHRQRYDWNQPGNTLL